jgi:hypothetical protein
MQFSKTKKKHKNINFIRTKITEVKRKTINGKFLDTFMENTNDIKIIS